MNRSSLAVRSALSLTAALVPFLLLAGCGGGDSSYNSGGLVGTPTPTPTATPVAGTRYFGSTFTVGGTGTVFVTAAAKADGSVTGTVSASDGRAVTRTVIGTGSVTGTLNLTTGAVTLSGSYVQNGVTTPISVTGTVPSSSGTGGVSALRLGESLYNAQWVVSTTTPIVGNNNNGGNASGGASALTFGANTSNITPGNLNAAVGVAIKQTLPFVGDILTITAADVVNGKGRTVSVIFTGAVPTAGASYDLSSSSDVAAGYTENTNSSSLKVFEATGGTVQVTAISGKTYTLKLTGVTVKAQTGGPLNVGTGTFTIDGTITATLP